MSKVNAAAEKADRKGAKKALFAVFGILMLLLAAAVCVAFGFVLRLMNGINYDRLGGGIVSAADVSFEQSDGPEAGTDLSTEESDALYDSICTLLTDENDLVYQENTTNILLIGTDNRYVGGHARADAIILLSVNRGTKQLVMTSIMRDTAVVISGRDHADKLTHSYAYGGAALLIKTIQANLGVRIDRYVAIDFYSFIDVVDCLGGIEMDVSESERKVMNRYVREINHYLKLDDDDGILNESGEDILLTGKQTLGYVRNRYSHGTADFGRTQRQRDVLERIIQKVSALGFFDQCELLNRMASNVTTDFTKAEMLSEILKFAQYRSYETVQSRIPADDTWHYARVNGASLVCCDFEKNRTEMIKTIYGDETLQSDGSSRQRDS